MLKCRHLTAPDFKIQPWKNGRGQTRELAVDPGSPYRWRVSVATLAESGPFSLFPGYDRHLVLLSGGPVALDHGTGVTRLLNAMTPYGFSGDLATTARMEGTGEDFNVFTLRGKAQARVYASTFATKEEVRFPLGATEHFLYCAHGEVEVLEQNLDEAFFLKTSEVLHLSKIAPQELLNLRVAAICPASILWVVVDC